MEISILKRLADAYEDALENDYCTSDIPEYEGLQCDEIVNKIICEIRRYQNNAG